MPDRDKIPYGTSLSALLVSIVQQAQTDGIITADESELINRIQIDARELEKEIASAPKDGSVSMKDLVKAASARMIHNATEIAKTDGVITDEEEAIINRLVKELEKVEL